MPSRDATAAAVCSPSPDSISKPSIPTRGPKSASRRASPYGGSSDGERLGTLAAKMTRYERVEDVLALVQALHTTGRGLTIDDIRERFGVSRRTAERMRDVVARAFPDLGFELDPSGRRRWRLPARARRPTCTIVSLASCRRRSAPHSCRFPRSPAKSCRRRCPRARARPRQVTRRPATAGSSVACCRWSDPWAGRPR